jgi:hypothetical protein
LLGKILTDREACCIFFFLFGGLNSGFAVARQTFYHLNHNSSPVVVITMSLS